LRRLSPTFVALFIAITVFLLACASKAPNEIHVAAAADLIPAFEEIGRQFEKSHSTKVIFSFGSTALLTRQIEQGAPMDVFAAANIGFVDQLEQKGLIFPDTKAVYARGRITIWTPKDSRLKLEKITDLTGEDVKRIAIANPEYAPYGMAAKEALQKAGIWETVKPRLIYGENIRQTFQFAETGNVDVAMVSLSLSSTSQGRWLLIPEELHQPINQGLAVIQTTKNEKAAREFATFVASPEGQEILARFGFEKPK
jgi:molybdate transport system substrate-binding protein